VRRRHAPGDVRGLADDGEHLALGDVIEADPDVEVLVRLGAHRRVPIAEEPQCSAIDCRVDGETAHHAVQPPSMSTLLPVAYEDASDARKSTAPRTSSAVMRRRIGDFLAKRSTNAGS